MSIEWLNDLVLTIAGIVLILVFIIFSVLGIILFYRVKSILNSLKVVTRNVEEISSYLSEDVIKPVASVVAVVKGVSQGVDAISKLFKK